MSAHAYSSGRSQAQNRALPTWRRKPLVGETDRDCFAVGLELNCPGHRWVIRART
jgi:hypothetical protein